jgi:hypothetical protein
VSEDIWQPLRSLAYWILGFWIGVGFYAIEPPSGVLAFLAIISLILVASALDTGGKGGKG